MTQHPALHPASTMSQSGTFSAPIVVNSDSSIDSDLEDNSTGSTVVAAESELDHHSRLSALSDIGKQRSLAWMLTLIVAGMFLYVGMLSRFVIVLTCKWNRIVQVGKGSPMLVSIEPHWHD